VYYLTNTLQYYGKFLILLKEMLKFFKAGNGFNEAIFTIYHITNSSIQKWFYSPV